MAGLYFFILLFNVVVAVSLALYSWRHRNAAGALPIVWLLLLGAEYTLAYFFELRQETLVDKLFYARIKHLGITLAPVFWLLFGLQYAYHPAGFRRRTLALLCLLPLATIVVVWTNDWHHLFWRNSRLIESDPFVILRHDYGPWLPVHVLYTYALVLSGTFIALRAVIRFRSPYRLRAIVLIVTSLIPFFGNLRFLFPGQLGLEPAPLLFSLTCVTLVLAVFRYSLLDVVPVGERALLESIRDAVLILDSHDLVVDVNPAAEQLFGVEPAQVIGQPLAGALQPWPELLNVLSALSEGRQEVACRHPGFDGYLAVRISTLHYTMGHYAGRLVLLEDITERRLAQQALEQAHQELEQRVQERTAQLRHAYAELERTHGELAQLAIAEERVRIARDIHDGLGHYLTVLSVQLQAATKLLADGDLNQASATVEACLGQAREAMQEVRRSVSVMRQGPLDELPLPEALATMVHKFDQRTPLAASFTCTGRPYNLAPAVAMTIYRAVQEGLTNAQRHALDATQVEVALNFGEDAVRLSVRDDGRPWPTTAHRSEGSEGGFGLAGLRERAEELQGSLLAAPADERGFVLTLTFPAQETVV